MAVSTGLPALKTLLQGDAVKRRFENILGQNTPAYISSIIDLYGDSQIAQCDNNLIVKECLRAATMKLPINRALGYAYLITFNTKVKEEFIDEKGVKQVREVRVKQPTFIPSTKGYIQLAMRSGQYKTINADKIYDGEFAGADKLSGTIDLSGQRKSDKVIGYFAYIELVNGFSKALFMNTREMAQYAKLYSPSVKYDSKVTVDSLMALAGKSPTGLGWVGDFDSMGIKTCLRRLLSKYGILSTELQTALENENKAETAESESSTKEEIEIEDVKYEDVTSSSEKPEQKQEQQLQCKF
ncbi:MAG: recombinase RecT [Bacteroidales bacterium]|nr:recombinase RecT [Bacteroidales bacterium]